MTDFSLTISYSNEKVLVKFSGELSLYQISSFEEQLCTINFQTFTTATIDLNEVTFFDTAASIFLNNFLDKLKENHINVSVISQQDDITETLKLVKKQNVIDKILPKKRKKTFMGSIGKNTHSYYIGFLSFMAFLGELFATKIHYLRSVKNIRFKEIAFEIHENGIRAFGIIALTSFLIGLVVAYQSAFQLKIYGANIFIVDMLGISMLRELAPLITAIVIAGRSGSAFTAQIGAMKITQELDAMRTMGFDPYVFLVMPRIIALMISMPILIFVADIMGVFGGMVVAHVDLEITTELFLERFTEVVAAKHFFIGILKGPFFAFLIASIGIYRGLMVKDDTQSIGYNTTKSVVESIFAVIVCDAIFSIVFTNMGI
jgi:phospholipid/cholesterol/gamma-HCH transport system permease protein